MPHSPFGEPLRTAREQAGLSIQDLATRTKIRGDYLRALEDSDLNALPERTFTRGYVRRYATELGLNPEPLIEEYDRAMPLKPEIARAMRGELAPRRRELPIAPIAAAISGLLLASAAGWWGYALWSSSAMPVAEPAPVSVPLETDRQVQLDVTSEPAGARVYLDNRYLGQTPIAQFPVEARDDGELRVELTGYRTAQQDVKLDQAGRIVVKLEKDVAPTPGTSGEQPEQPAQPAPRSTVTQMPITQAPAAQTTQPPAAQKATAQKPASTKPDTQSPAAPTPAVNAAKPTPTEPKPETRPVVKPEVKPASAGVTLKFTGQSWVRVTDSAGKVLFEGIPAVGSTRGFPANVRVRVGSAGAVQATVNGGKLAPLGAVGQVVERRLP